MKKLIDTKVGKIWCKALNEEEFLKKYNIREVIKNGVPKLYGKRKENYESDLPKIMRSDPLIPTYLFYICQRCKTKFKYRKANPTLPEVNAWLKRASCPKCKNSVR